MSELTHEQVIKKIKKLLALSESSNENEAQSALLKAQHWMAKYNISLGAIEGEKEKKDVIHSSANEQAERRVWWKGRLAYIIGENFKCYTYNQSFGSKIFIKFLGKEDDVEIAIQVYRHACSMVEHYAKKYVRERKKELEKKAGVDFKKFQTIQDLELWAEQQGVPTGRMDAVRIEYGHDTKIRKMRLIMLIKDELGLSLPNGIKNDYIVGFLNGLSDKFREQKEQNKSEWGLVLVKDKDVVEAYDKMKFTKSKGSSASRLGDKHATSSGYKQGKSYGGAPKGHIKK